jgi:hypothetical protein
VLGAVVHHSFDALLHFSPDDEVAWGKRLFWRGVPKVSGERDENGKRGHRNEKRPHPKSDSLSSSSLR